MAQREAIVDAAFETLLAEGPEFAVAAVARRAGASKALVFHHFGDREGLLDAMAARVLAETRAGLDALAAEEPNPRERIAALARALLAAPAEPPAASRRILRFWLSEDRAGACRAAARDALVSAFLASAVRDGVAMGALRPGADPAALASLLLARWHGATAAHAAGVDVDFDGEADRLVRDALATAAPLP